MPDKAVQLNRIDAITSKLNSIWKQYPHWRFNQVVFYINSLSYKDERKFFAISDDEFSQLMDKSIATTYNE